MVVFASDADQSSDTGFHGVAVAFYRHHSAQPRRSELLLVCAKPTYKDAGAEVHDLLLAYTRQQAKHVGSRHLIICDERHEWDASLLLRSDRGFECEVLPEHSWTSIVQLAAARLEIALTPHDQEAEARRRVDTATALVHNQIEAARSGRERQEPSEAAARIGEHQVPVGQQHIAVWFPADNRYFKAYVVSIDDKVAGGSGGEFASVAPLAPPSNSQHVSYSSATGEHQLPLIHSNHGM